MSDVTVSVRTEFSQTWKYPQTCKQHKRVPHLYSEPSDLLKDHCNQDDLREVTIDNRDKSVRSQSPILLHQNDTDCKIIFAAVINDWGEKNA